MPAPISVTADLGSQSAANLGGDVDTGDRIFRFGDKSRGADPRFQLATAVVIGLAAVAALFVWTRR